MTSVSGWQALDQLVLAYQKEFEAFMLSLEGIHLEFEHRPVSEIMELPIFKEIPEKYLTGLITEKGMIKPDQLLSMVHNSD